MKLWKITFFGTLFILFILVFAFTIGFSANQPGSFYNKGHNAVWIGHEWVGQEHSEGEVQKLVETLRENEIDTVFVHSGPLNEQGSVAPETYKYALDFLEKARVFDKEIEYQAWLGQIRQKINLDDAEIRHNTAKLAMNLSQLIGFDGVHFDIEPVWDNDTAFIELLKETREVMPPEKKISVALAEFIPGSLIWILNNHYQFENYNSEVNYKNVAEYADQVVVMAYDTSISDSWLYRWLVKEQTIWLTDLLPEKEVFIGLPAYDEEKPGFDPKVENLKNGLLGVIAGLNNLRSDVSGFAGVAIYPYWQISEKEWQTYQLLWIK